MKTSLNSFLRLRKKKEKPCVYRNLMESLEFLKSIPECTVILGYEPNDLTERFRCSAFGTLPEVKEIYTNLGNLEKDEPMEPLFTDDQKKAMRKIQEKHIANQKPHAAIEEWGQYQKLIGIEMCMGIFQDDELARLYEQEKKIYFDMQRNE